MLAPLQTDLASAVEGVNLVWVLTVTFLILFVHVSFATLEAGQVRAKNVANQLVKNLLTWSIGVIVFSLLGAAVSSIVAALTSGSTLDITGAFMSLYAPDALATTAWVDWLFGAVLIMTAATTAPGAAAGRARLHAYLTYTILIADVTCSVVVGFTWSGGFPDTLSFCDFAGGMIAHGMGGTAGLIAVWIIGLRTGRLKPGDTANVTPGHSITFAVSDTPILAFDWYGFNVSTVAALLAYADGAATLGSLAYVGRAALVTTLGMAAGAIGAGGVAIYKTGKVDTLCVADGVLAGLVSITVIVDDIVWPGALVVGLLAGAQLPVVFKLAEKRLRIDDVCAVFPVRGLAGVPGTLLYPVFAVPLRYDGASFVSLAVLQIVGAGIIAVWTFVATAVAFDGSRALGQVCVSSDREHEGLDTAKRGVDTYLELGSPDHDTGIRTDGSGVPSGDGFMTTGRED